MEIDDAIFQFQAKSLEEKEAWIGAVGKAMLKGSMGSVIMQEDDNE